VTPPTANAAPLKRSALNERKLVMVLKVIESPAAVGSLLEPQSKKS
jgi:hypothetical protein